VTSSILASSWCFTTCPHRPDRQCVAGLQLGVADRDLGRSLDQPAPCDLGAAAAVILAAEIEISR